MFDSIFTKTGDMKLKIGPDSTIGRFLTRARSIDYPFDASLAITKDRAARVAGGGCTGSH
jgi:hypothetical protein